MNAWFFLVPPIIIGVWGLILLLNIFGTTNDLSKFYKGRGDWYPILQGDNKSTHRVAGAALLSTGIVLTAAVLGMHIV
jgi:ABC-type phosphate transport system permease subunit